MATQDPKGSAVTFPTTGEGLYVFDPDAPEMDIADQLTARLDQLSAMLVFTYGEQLEDFDRMSEGVRSSYMCGCASAVNECRDLVARLGELAFQRRLVAQAADRAGPGDREQ